MACSAVLVVTVGCRRSPFQRLTEVPPGPHEPAAGVERQAIPDLAPVVATPTAATIRTASPAPVEPHPEAEAEAEAEAAADATPTPTPMLDAALRRAEVEEQQRAETIRAIATAQPIPPDPVPDPQPEPVSEPEPAPAEPAAPPTDEAVKPASAEVEVEVEAAKTPDPEPVTAAEPPSVEPRPEPEPRTPEPEPPAPSPITDEPPPLTIGAATLCRKINGFGSFEPLNASALRPGKSALVYCELSGLEYRPEGDGFAAHVATRVELIRPDDGGKAWEISGEAPPDRCRTKRRDSYVGTLITLPESIAPGPYTLRLYQADAASGRTASAEIPVTIAR